VLQALEIYKSIPARARVISPPIVDLPATHENSTPAWPLGRAFSISDGLLKILHSPVGNP
jgi:hypothetical protein